LPTVSQLVRVGGEKLRSKTDSPALHGSPQTSWASCVRVFTVDPEEAQLGLRKVARVG
jgi:ribosomal protein S12